MLPSAGSAGQEPRQTSGPGLFLDDLIPNINVMAKCLSIQNAKKTLNKAILAPTPNEPKEPKLQTDTVRNEPPEINNWMRYCGNSFIEWTRGLVHIVHITPPIYDNSWYLFIDKQNLLYNTRGLQPYPLKLYMGEDGFLSYQALVYAIRADVPNEEWPKSL